MQVKADEEFTSGQSNLKTTNLLDPNLKTEESIDPDQLAVASS